MAKLVEVITLMSSDEDSPSEVNAISIQEKEITVKVEETEKDGTTRKQSNSKMNHSTTHISPSAYPVAANSKFHANANVSKSSNSVIFNSNSSSLVKPEINNIKLPRTARKSINSFSNSHSGKNLNHVTITNSSYTNPHNHQTSRTETKSKQSNNFPHKTVTTQVDVLPKEGMTNCRNAKQKVVFHQNVVNNKNVEKQNMPPVSNSESILPLLNEFEKKGLTLTSISNNHSGVSSNGGKTTLSSVNNLNGGCFRSVDIVEKKVLSKPQDRTSAELPKINRDITISKSFPSISKDLNIGLKDRSNSAKISSPNSITDAKRKQPSSSIDGSVSTSSAKKMKLNSCANFVPLSSEKISKNAASLNRALPKSTVTRPDLAVISVSPEGFADLTDTKKKQASSSIDESISASSAKKMKLNCKADIVSLSREKISKKAATLNRDLLKSTVARPDLAVIPVSPEGVAHLNRTSKSTSQGGSKIEAVRVKLLNRVNQGVAESNNSSKALPELTVSTTDLSDSHCPSRNISTENSGVNVVNLNKKLNDIKMRDQPINLTKTSCEKFAVDVSTKNNSVSKSDKNVIIQLVDSEKKEEHVSQRVPQVLSSATEDLAMRSEKPKTQAKQVTSPKLSLKRKREEGSMENFAGVKKGLFFHLVNDAIDLPLAGNKDEGISTLPNLECTSAHPIDMEELRPSDHSKFADSLEMSQLPTEVKDSLPELANQTISAATNEQKFEKLLEFCIPKLKFSPEEETRMRMVMHKKISRAAISYLSSLEFSNSLDTTYEKIKNNPNKVITHLNELKAELSAYKQKSSKYENYTSRCDSPSLIPEKIGESHSTYFLDDKSDVKTETLNCPSEVCVERNSPPPNVLPDMPTVSCSAAKDANIKFLSNLDLRPIQSVKASTSKDDTQAKIERRIQKLEKFLGLLDKKIKKLQMKELSLDDLDDDDSAYVKEEKYKRKFNRTYTLLCKLRNTSTRLGREIERRFRYKGSRYQEINQAVERFINKRKVAEKFPNYVEILNLVKNVNDTVQIGLRESDYHSLARDIFKDVGNELKRRRRVDEEREFGCFLTDNVNLEDDPAEKDEELHKKLASSIVEGERKLKEVIEKYASKQEEGPNEEDATEDEESDEKLEPEYRDVDDNLPDTDPASLASEQDDSNLPDAAPGSPASGPENIEVDSNLPNTAPASPASGLENIELDSNLPNTAPTSPASETALPSVKLKQNRRDGVAVIDIASDSDASTDPGCNNVKPEELPDLSSSASVHSPVLCEIPSTIESDSSCDLPSL